MSNTRDNSREQKLQAETKPKHHLTVDVAAGLFTGVFCSGLFNPWDRALYLSVKNNKPFLTLENFKNPYQGFTQAVVQRAFLGSIYYILRSELKYHLDPYLQNTLNAGETISQFCVGSTAGSISGLLSNSISAIKYYTWGQENRSFFSSASEMWSKGGIKPFIKGTKATMGRDLVFGSIYEVSRHLMKNKISKPQNLNDTYLNFIYNSTSAGIATLFSSPLNYARNIQFATPPQENPPTVLQVLVNVWNESKQHKTHTFARLGFFQQKFRIGWGTTRVAVGMAVGQNVFDTTCAKLKSKVFST